jgi:hypothetical protein
MESQKRRERLALNLSQNEREAIEGGRKERVKAEDYRIVKITIVPRPKQSVDLQWLERGAFKS